MKTMKNAKPLISQEVLGMKIEVFNWLDFENKQHSKGIDIIFFVDGCWVECMRSEDWKEYFHKFVKIQTEKISSKNNDELAVINAWRHPDNDFYFTKILVYGVGHNDPNKSFVFQSSSTMSSGYTTPEPRKIVKLNERYLTEESGFQTLKKKQGFYYFVNDNKQYSNGNEFIDFIE